MVGFRVPNLSREWSPLNGGAGNFFPAHFYMVEFSPRHSQDTELCLDVLVLILVLIREEVTGAPIRVTPFHSKWTVGAQQEQKK